MEQEKTLSFKQDTKQITYRETAYMHETSLISNSKFKETTSSKDSQFVMLNRNTQKDFVYSNHVLCFVFFCCQLLQTWIRCNG